MNQLTFEMKYAGNDELRERLYPLFEKVFGIQVDTFKDFYARGFWDPTYIPFTFFNGDTAVANVSVFEMPLMINGEKVLVAGIQSVMTDPDYRGKGLMKSLMHKALEYIDTNYEYSFLMTSNPVLYTKYGFKVIKEHFFTKLHLHDAEKVENKLERLTIFDPADMQKIRWAFKNNTPTSVRFYPPAYAPSFYLNMYNPMLREMLYFSPDLNVILIFEIDEETLELYDIIGPELPTLEQIYSVIPQSFNKVNLYFPPDLLGEGFSAVEYEDVDFLMVRGDIDVESLQIKLPITAEF
ncbi:GNAT family N-acetyltransferase [Sporosarcina sp. ACRSL]|uniref:GNAT family N-acetyltransferase n=1 Tax=Sporosarcina sp. ACRSL TaxID=2918215 RepID=UPI001EF6CF91|nr:GNAT family N-acetyltransferase [Sporosarcina sp. ACRSL]MCG7342560.1 GNAT family N-acetyltransferase [Sporosarcina sp. ACRSL]